MKYRELLNGVNPNWSVKEKAKYLYDSLCKNIYYDQRFTFSHNPELLNSIYYKDVDIDKDLDPRIVCRTANILYSQLLKECGIDCELIYKKPKEQRLIDADDVALVFYDENKDKYFTNIVADLQNCKYGLKTHFFGIAENEYEKAQDVKEIEKDELFEIDKSTNYIKRDSYSDIVFELLVDEVKNTNHFKNYLNSIGIDSKSLTSDEVLKYKVDLLTKYIKFRDKCSGPLEQKKFYQRLFRSASLDRFESKKFTPYEYVKEDSDSFDIVSFLSVNLDEEPIYFCYSDEEQGYVSISQDDLKEKLKGYRPAIRNKTAPFFDSGPSGNSDLDR